MHVDHISINAYTLFVKKFTYMGNEEKEKKKDVYATYFQPLGIIAAGLLLDPKSLNPRNELSL